MPVVSHRRIQVVVTAPIGCAGADAIMQGAQHPTQAGTGGETVPSADAAALALLV